MSIILKDLPKPQFEFEELIWDYSPMPEVKCMSPYYKLESDVVAFQTLRMRLKAVFHRKYNGLVWRDLDSNNIICVP